jgi:hypothetical protein
LPREGTDRVALPACGLELAPQVLDRLSLIGNQLTDSLRDSVLDPADLPADLVDVGVLRRVALALTPQARMLVAQVRDRPPDTAIDA